MASNDCGDGDEIQRMEEVVGHNGSSSIFSDTSELVADGVVRALASGVVVDVEVVTEVLGDCLHSFDSDCVEADVDDAVSDNDAVDEGVVVEVLVEES
jgi:hypothetical protein